MNKQTGFTLMELLITMAIAAIVLGIGVPSFQEVVSNNRLTANANDFLASMTLARSESIKRGQRVTLCKSTDGATCAAGGSFEQGWIIFADPNATATVDTGEPILQINEALPDGMTLIGNAFVVNYISYIPAGTTRTINGGLQAGTLTLCKAHYETSARQLIIGTGGRVRVQRIDNTTSPTVTAACP